jgi:hypothetical protein
VAVQAVEVISMTRKDYMDGVVSFEQYYTTIAEESGVSFKNADIIPCVVRALANGDEHLNSIPLSTWHSYAIYEKPATSPVFKVHGDSWSLAGGVCVAKQAAKNAAKAEELCKQS